METFVKEFEMESSRCKAFIMAAETGSFSRAAEILSYTPSGVSQLVKAFEKELGFNLLMRSKKGVSLTDDGVRLLPAVRNFLAQENRIYEIAAEIKGLVIGSVNIAAYSSISAHWLAGVIKDFQEDYPNVKIKLLEGVRQEVSGWIEDQSADVAFLSYKPDMEYDWIPLAEDRMMAVLPKTHPLSEAESYPIRNCQSEDFIMPSFGHDDDVTALFAYYHLNPHIKFSTLEYTAAMSMIEKGLGMGIMNELITQNWECDVARIPLDPPEYITLGIAVPSLENTSPAVKRFIEYAEKSLKCI